MATVTVHYYDSSATRIVRTRSYSTPELARRAMARAAKRRQVCAIGRTRTASSQPTCHH